MSIKPIGPGYNQDGQAIYPTDSRAGTSLYVGTVAPTGPRAGDVWIDSSVGTEVLTTKGDILTFDGLNQARVAVGSNGQALVADSTNSSGLAWASQADEISAIMGVY